MKTALKLTLIAIICMSFDTINTSWKSNNYMIIDDLGAKTYSTEAYCVYNKGAFAFYTQQYALKVFNITESGRKVVKGKPEVTYLSPDNSWMVTLRTPDEIEVQAMKGPSRSFVFHKLKLYDSDYNTFINAYSNKK